MQIMLEVEYCFYCERELKHPNVGNKLFSKTKDHVIPLCKGGSKNAKINIVNCCLGCNLFKGGLMPDEFLQKVNRQITTCSASHGIANDLMPTIAKNVEVLVKRVETQKDKMMKKKPSAIDPRTHDGEFHVVIKKDAGLPTIAQINKRAKQISKKTMRQMEDISLSVNNNLTRHIE